MAHIIGNGKYNNLGKGLRGGNGVGCFILNAEISWSYHGNKNGAGFGYGPGDVQGRGDGLAVGKEKGAGKGIEYVI